MLVQRARLAFLQALLGVELGTPADHCLSAEPRAALLAPYRSVLRNLSWKMMQSWPRYWFYMNDRGPCLEMPTRSPRSEVRLKASPRGSSDSTSFPLSLDLVLFFLDPEEFSHCVLLVSCALRIEHEAHRAVLQPRL